jgi:hypothetical protein
MNGFARMSATPEKAPAGPVRIGGGTDRAEQLAHDAERYDAVAPVAGPAWSFSRIPLNGQSGPVVDVRLDGAGEPVPAHDDLPPAEGVRVHTGPAAADTAERAGANAVTVGSHIAFAPGAYAPHSPAGRRLLRHEIAHATQPSKASPVARRDQKTSPAPVTTLAGLPEADRKKLTLLSTDAVHVIGLDDKFATQGVTTTLPLPSGTTVVTDPSAAAVQSHGMNNIVAALTTTIDFKTIPLAPGSTVTLKLDLSKHGGIDGLYRFTHVVGTQPDPNRVIVEQLGPAKDAPGTQVPASTTPGTAPADPIADKMTAAGITTALSGSKLEALRSAISQVPASQLSLITGLTVRFESSPPPGSKEAGRYDPATHTVFVNPDAFAADDTRYGTGTVSSSHATRVFLHEIGHAIDYAPIRAKNVAQKAAAADLANLSKKYPDGSGGYTYPLGGPEEKEAKGVEKASREADAALLAAKSRSGTGVVKQGQDFVDVIGAAQGGNEFRAAAAKDGQAVSAYGRTDWQESYAETYAFYISDPQTLKAVRPATWAYFDKTLPK